VVWTVLLDVLLLVVLLALLVSGLRGGFARSVSAILGLAAGAVAAYLLMPLLAGVVPWPAWRVLLILVCWVLLLVLGHAAGAAIGRAIGRGDGADSGPGGVSRLLGAAVSVGTGSLVIALVAGSVGGLGAPVVSQAVQQSLVVGAIDRITPEPLDAALAQLRGAVLAQGMPEVEDPLGGVTAEDPPAPPPAGEPGSGSAALDAARDSIVRIAGTAFACGVTQTGSGAVIAADRVVTNAHVVAGVEQPLVEAPNGQVLEGRVVLFDPRADLAVLAVPGLDVPALELGGALEPGDAAVAGGYPYGGPYEASPAEVLAVSTERLRDIYGGALVDREVYTLAVDVSPGDSGGPLLDTAGEVAGLVFAQAAGGERLGYALTPSALDPVVTAAPGLDAAVSAGACVPR